MSVNFIILPERIAILENCVNPGKGNFFCSGFPVSRENRVHWEMSDAPNKHLTILLSGVKNRCYQILGVCRSTVQDRGQTGLEVKFLSLRLDWIGFSKIISIFFYIKFIIH